MSAEISLIPRAHAGRCVFCQDTVDMPVAAMYDQMLNERVKICSDHCLIKYREHKLARRFVPLSVIFVPAKKIVLSPKGFNESPI